MEIPRIPATFTKFPASLAGPFDPVERPGNTMDWEVELVAVIGNRADRASSTDAWGHIAGLAVGAVLLFVAATSLPCQPRSVLLLTSTLSFIAFAWLSVGTLLRIERDPVLSLIADSVGGRVTKF